MDRAGTRRPAALPHLAPFSAIAVCVTLAACTPRPAAPPPVVSAPTPGYTSGSITPVAPEPAQPDLAETFYPHGAGSTWTMAATAGPDKWQLTLKAVADKGAQAEPAPARAAAPLPGGDTLAAPAEPVPPTAARTWAVETRRDGELAQVERYRADETGVYLVGFGPDGLGRIEPPMPVLKAPFAPGATWKWQGVFVDEGVQTPGEAEFTIKGPEALEVPAGKYAESYCVEQTFRLGSAHDATLRMSKQWLVPRVGLVQQQTVDDALSMTARLLAHRQGPGAPR